MVPGANIAKEVVFDEQEIERCYLTSEDELIASMRDRKTDPHPGYPVEAIRLMMKARHAHRYAFLSVA